MTYLVKPMSYVLVIALGFALKRAGFFRREDYRIFSKVMINVTLPCAIIQAVEGFTRDLSMVIIALSGFFCALLPPLLMFALSRREEKSVRAYRMVNIGGYNIGCFSLPLVEAFFGSAGVAAACLFDIGNAVMMTGGAYTLTSTLLRTGTKRESVGEIIRKFLSSAPFDTYMILLTLLALDIRVPDLVLDLTRPAAQANGFIAMLTIGLMFEPKISRGDLGIVGRELAWRYAIAAVFACALYFLAPLPHTARMTLAVICFAPLSSLAPIYTERCGGSGALASFTNSASIAVSLVLMMAVSMMFIA